jgi:hypothetical protein
VMRQEVWRKGESSRREALGKLKGEEVKPSYAA